jgi:hypothetical protein
MELKIDGLTVEQCRLLDCIWAIQDKEEFESWFCTLQYRTMQEVESLLELIRLEMMERYLNMDSLSTARAYIDNIRSRN